MLVSLAPVLFSLVCGNVCGSVFFDQPNDLVDMRVLDVFAVLHTEGDLSPVENVTGDGGLLGRGVSPHVCGTGPELAIGLFPPLGVSADRGVVGVLKDKLHVVWGHVEPVKGGVGGGVDCVVEIGGIGPNEGLAD